MSETSTEADIKPDPITIGNTVYKPELGYDGKTWYLRDAWGDPPPGDPDGRWQARPNQLARGHRMQHMWGWEYRQTAAFTGDPFDCDAPPPGDGWELNTYAGEGGYGTGTTGSGREQNVAYWRRRATKP